MDLDSRPELLVYTKRYVPIDKDQPVTIGHTILEGMWIVESNRIKIPLPGMVGGMASSWPKPFVVVHRHSRHDTRSLLEFLEGQ